MVALLCGPVSYADEPAAGEGLDAPFDSTATDTPLDADVGQFDETRDETPSNETPSTDALSHETSETSLVGDSLSDEIRLSEILGGGTPVTDPYEELGELELQLVNAALFALGRAPEHAPEGRDVCNIEVITEDVVTEADPYPMWLNRLHMTTRDDVVRRALTFSPGEPWDAIRVADSEAAIGDPTVYAVVTIVPMRSDVPGCVDVLVLTKDVWSLRGTVLPQSFGSYTELSLGGSETNFLGRNLLLAGSLHIEPLQWDVGAVVHQRHVLGSQIEFYEGFRLHLDQEGEGLNGSENLLVLRRRLYDSTDRLGWALEVSHFNAVQRIYEGSRVSTYEAETSTGVVDVPERWRQNSVALTASVTRSFGFDWKQNLTPFWFYERSEFVPDPRALSGEGPSVEALETFRDDRLPRDERATGPGVLLEIFENRRRQLQNIETYATSESFWTGLEIDLQTQLSEPNFGARDRFVSSSAGIAYSVPFADAVVRASISRSFRYDGELSDQLTTATLFAASPDVFAGRLVLYTEGRLASDNVNNVVHYLGTDTGNRGFPTATAVGERYLIGNVEWRTRSAEWLGSWWGGVVFFDAGTVWDEGEQPSIVYPALGLGLRWVLPQLWSVVRAFDLGFPLAHGRPIRIGGRDTAIPIPTFSFRIGQVYVDQ